MTQSEKVSRKDEIRALFIFGLLAVFASIRVQYSQLIMNLGYGSINLVPIVDFIIALWSLYAFFMVIGLSGDIVGKVTANVFRDVSKVFLQYSYIILGVFLIPIGFIAYGERIILLIGLIILVVAVGFVVLLSKKPNLFRKRSKPLSAYRISWIIKKRLPFIVGLIFLFSAYVMLNYPKTWFAPMEMPVIAFIVSAIAVAIIIMREKKSDDSYTSDDDYYC